MTIRVDASDFHHLAARQRDVESRLRREVEKATTEAARPVDREVAAAAKRLPGGLAEFVAGADIRVRPVVESNGAGVEITAKRTNSHGHAADLAAIDAGTVHHRVYGHGKPIAQSVPSGFWSQVMKGPLADRARRSLLEALDKAARGK